MGNREGGAGKDKDEEEEKEKKKKQANGSFFPAPSRVLLDKFRDRACSSPGQWMAKEH